MCKYLHFNENKTNVVLFFLLDNTVLLNCIIYPLTRFMSSLKSSFDELFSVEVSIIRINITFLFKRTENTHRHLLNKSLLFM